MQAKISDQQLPWTRKDMADESRWIHHLTKAEIDDLRNALTVAKKNGADCASLNKETFPLDAMLPAIDKTLHHLENDFGIFSLRGFPAAEYNSADLRLIYWGLGLHMGTAVPQSSKGDLLGDVRDVGDDFSSQTGRGYMSSGELGFHTDTCDVVGLSVLQIAKQGGSSKIASSLAIHNEIAQTRPDLLDVLYQPFVWSWKGYQDEGELPFYFQPVYSVMDGYFCSRHNWPHIYSVQEVPGVPQLSQIQKDALALIDTIAERPDMHFEMTFQPGDYQFLNNHVTYHARTDYVDFPEPERKRHLIRLWLAVPNSRPLSPMMSAIYRDQTPGALRGGFPSRASEPVYSTFEDA